MSKRKYGTNRFAPLGMLSAKPLLESVLIVENKGIESRAIIYVLFEVPIIT